MWKNQLFGKPPVAALQVFFAKRNFEFPTYYCTDFNNGSFICKAEAASTKALRHGGFKREANQDAKANIIKRIKIVYPDSDGVPEAHVTESATDVIITLQDYCVQYNHPLPTFEIIQRADIAEAPEFEVLCTLSTIKRYGKAKNKKDARQKAALEVFKLILENDTVEHHMQVASLETKFEDVESERYRKFKTYRELTNSKTGETPGILLCDRHNYFSKFYENLKKEAIQIIRDSHESYKTKALEIFKCLKITPKISVVPVQSTLEAFLFIEFNCDYDVAFTGPERIIYKNITNYLSDMLY